MKKVLISGAGVAGLTLAYWLKKFGFVPTIVEKHPSLRTGGYKVDLRGVALEILKRMDLHPAIVEARTKIKYAVCVDSKGNQVSEMTPDLLGTRLEGVDLEIMRGTLCVLMKEAVGDSEYIFGDTITSIADKSDGIFVEFENHPARTFDLVIGADGLHSTVRKLVFGDEGQFSQEFGVYISVFSFQNFINLSDCEIEQHSLRKFVNLYGDCNDVNAKAALAFSLPQPFSFRDPQEQQNCILEAFKDATWELPRILAEMKNSSDFFFDSMAQIHMPRWSQGRVALVGDAAYSASPMSGQGTSMAIAGAYMLAGELAETRDYLEAFTRYETELRPFVKKNQDLALMSARIMSGSLYSIVLHRLVALLPRRIIRYFQEKALVETTAAANALTLKDYHGKNR